MAMMVCLTEDPDISSSLFARPAFRDACRTLFTKRAKPAELPFLSFGGTDKGGNRTKVRRYLLIDAPAHGRALPHELLSAMNPLRTFKRNENGRGRGEDERASGKLSLRAYSPDTS